MRKILASCVAMATMVCSGTSHAVNNSPNWFGLDYSLNNPGARANAMGGAFVGVANDASAPVANPAGLAALTDKKQFVFEASVSRRDGIYIEGADPGPGTGSIQQTLDADSQSDSGINYMAVTLPLKDSGTVIGFFFSNLMRTESSVSMFSPGSTELLQESSTLIDIDEYGLSLGKTMANGKLQLGASYSNASLNGQITTNGNNSALGIYGQSNFVSNAEQQAVVRLGALYQVSEKLKLGMTYSRMPDFDIRTYASVGNWSIGNTVCYGDYISQISNETLRYGNYICEETVSVPDVLSLGASFAASDNLLVSAEARRVSYSETAKDVKPLYAYTGGTVVETSTADQFSAEDVIELHIGAEYVTFRDAKALAYRAGLYRVPAHGIKYSGDDNTTRIMFDGGEDETHVTLGFGVAGKALQFDTSLDMVNNRKTLLISAGYQF